MHPAIRQRGFTLLEICLVILIIALIMGALIPMFGGSMENEGLRRTAAEFEKAARTARAMALGSGYAAELRMDKKQFQLHAFRPSTGNGTAPELVEESFPLRGASAWQIRTWLKPRWRTPNEEHWVFQPSGLVEPLTVRFMRGEAYVELAFNPLTGETEDEKYYFP